MKRKLTTLFFILIFLIGLGLVLVQPISQLAIRSIADDLNQVSAEEIERNDQLEASFDFDETTTLTIKDVMDAQLNRSDLAVIGTIIAPTVDMQLPIVKGVSNYALAVGAGTMKASQKMGEGNYALAGHYFNNKPDLLFSPLYNTQIGDLIYVTNKTEVYAYKIYNKEVISASSVHIIQDQPNKTLLTLITCANDGVDRLAIQAEFVDVYTFEEMEEKLF
jgi:sortase A